MSPFWTHVTKLFEVLFKCVNDLRDGLLTPSMAAGCCPLRPGDTENVEKEENAVCSQFQFSSIIPKIAWLSVIDFVHDRRTRNSLSAADYFDTNTSWQHSILPIVAGMKQASQMSTRARLTNKEFITPWNMRYIPNSTVEYRCSRLKYVETPCKIYLQCVVLYTVSVLSYPPEHELLH
jgi:hypothetical protein